MRRKDREITNTEEIINILETAMILHLGLLDGEYPYVVPLHYGYEFKNDTIVFYVHGANEGHKIDLIRSDPNVCVELECNVEPISGGDIPCGYGSTYASIIGRGEAELLEDPAEKIHGLNTIMQHQTNRHFDFSPEMAAGVAVIKITAHHFTAKAKKAA